MVLLAQEIVVGPSSYPTEEIGERAGVPPARARLRQPRRVPDGQRLRLRLRRGPRRRGGDHGADDGPRRTCSRRRSPRRSGRTTATPRTARRTTTSCACTATRRTRSRTRGRRPPLLAAARETWNEAVALGEHYGYRNAQATVLAPTGTISFLMDCDTTGIEPDFSLVKYKELVGGGTMTIANRTVPMALRTLGYSEPQVEQIEAYVDEHGTIVGAPGLSRGAPAGVRRRGRRARDLAPGHIKMMGAVQPFLSGAISKTVNMPQTATVEDIAEAYIQAWKLGVKALAIYRDGSKTAQALRTDAQEVKEVKAKAEAAISPARRCSRRPRSRRRVEEAVAKAVERPRPARRPGPQADAARAQVADAQVLARRPRGLHHRRHVRGRDGRGDLPHRHRQGGLDAPRHDELVRDRDLHRAAVRRAARDARAKFAYMRFEPEGITRTRRSRSRSRCPTTSCGGSRRGSSTPTPRRSSASSRPRSGRGKMAQDAGDRRDGGTRPGNGGNGHRQRRRRRKDTERTSLRPRPPPPRPAAQGRRPPRRHPPGPPGPPGPPDLGPAC